MLKEKSNLIASAEHLSERARRLTEENTKLEDALNRERKAHLETKQENADLHKFGDAGLRVAERHGLLQELGTEDDGRFGKMLLKTVSEQETEKEKLDLKKGHSSGLKM